MPGDLRSTAALSDSPLQVTIWTAVAGGRLHAGYEVRSAVVNAEPRTSRPAVIIIAPRSWPRSYRGTAVGSTTIIATPSQCSQRDSGGFGDRCSGVVERGCGSPTGTRHGSGMFPYHAAGLDDAAVIRKSRWST